jgi:hypothetical protein
MGKYYMRYFRKDYFWILEIDDDKKHGRCIYNRGNQVYYIKGREFDVYEVVEDILPDIHYKEISENEAVAWCI